MQETTSPFNLLSQTPDNGYSWLYFDGESDDGRYRFVCIGMVGNIFSPAYAQEKTKGRASPFDHCAFNFVIYAPHKRFWVCSAYPWAQTHIGQNQISLGNNIIQSTHDGFQIDVNDRSATLLGIGSEHLLGSLKLSVDHLGDQDIYVDARQQHLWRPIAPDVRFTCAFTQPALRFAGTGYIDHNRGSVAPEATLRHWRWARFHQPGSAWLFFYTQDSAGESCHLSFQQTGKQLRAIAPLSGQTHTLNRPFWGMRPIADCPPGTLKYMLTLEDAPFYTRHALEIENASGHPRHRGICENIDFRRFSYTWVQYLLPYKMRHYG